MQEEDKIEHVRSLPQVKEDPALQKIAWKMQNVCWVVIRIFMLLIAAGLFGNGPISNVRETKNNITLEYDRFSRHQGSMTTTIRLAVAGPVVDIRIPVAYLSEFQLETVFPDSYESKIEDGAVVYSFETKNNESLTVHFFAHPEKPGIVSGNWTVNRSTFPVSHLIYP